MSDLRSLTFYPTTPTSSQIKAYNSKASFEKQYSLSPKAYIRSYSRDKTPANTISIKPSLFSPTHSQNKTLNDSSNKSVNLSKSKFGNSNFLPPISSHVRTFSENSSYSFGDLAQVTEGVNEEPNLDSKLSFKNDQEECQMRFKIVYKNILELNKMQAFDQHTYKSVRANYLTEDNKKTFRLAEPVFAAMGIQVRPCLNLIWDSGMVIQPVEDYQLASFYKLFIPEMCRFNYVFLSKLRIGIITVCGSLELTNIKFASVLEQKLHSGLFVMDKMIDKKSVQKHWFKIIIYHFLKAVTGFNLRWQNLMQKIYCKGEKIDEFHELIVTFGYLFSLDREEYKGNIPNQIKVDFLKEEISKFDYLTGETLKQGK